jgi:hypothetical protein
MNHFQLSYPERLQEWASLREKIKNNNLETQCVMVDKWWQHAPLVNHYLHPYDIKNWPDPWQLIHENMYCHVARGLGMCYTMYLVGQKDVELVEASDVYGDDCYLVLVDCGKYIMNYIPDTVLNNNLASFKIKNKIDISEVISRIK